VFADEALLSVGEVDDQGEQLGVGEGEGEGIGMVANINTGAFDPSTGPGTADEFEEFGDQLSTDNATFWSYGAFTIYGVLVVGVVDGSRSAAEVNGQLELPNTADSTWSVLGGPTISGSLTLRILNYDGSNLNYMIRRNSAPGTLYAMWSSPGSWDGVSPIALDPTFSDGKWDNSSSIVYIFPLPE
jgi:hypothetical protein